MNDEEKFYAPVELASIFSVHTQTILRWLRDPNHPLNGHKMSAGWRVSQAQLKAYIESWQ